MAAGQLHSIVCLQTHVSERPWLNPLSGGEAMLYSNNVSGLYVIFPLWKAEVALGFVYGEETSFWGKTPDWSQINSTDLS